MSEFAPEIEVTTQLGHKVHWIGVDATRRVLMLGGVVGMQSVLELVLTANRVDSAMAYLSRRTEDLQWINGGTRQREWTPGVHWRRLDRVVLRTCRFLKERDLGEQFVCSHLFAVLLAKAEANGQRHKRAMVIAALRRAVNDLYNCQDHDALLREHPDVAELVQAIAKVDGVALIARRLLADDVDNESTDSE